VGVGARISVGASVGVGLDTKGDLLGEGKGIEDALGLGVAVAAAVACRSIGVVAAGKGKVPTAVDWAVGGEELHATTKPQMINTATTHQMPCRGRPVFIPVPPTEWGTYPFDMTAKASSA
jgi:hypothetical protein